ncbi:hypothetical protein ANANG_G00295120 [Anguilla anguilla]|uniref:EGF-like domain-containing protein n=1 Tax=Anguilla anguilla TaxID=7936 RepID=A0A9D3RJF1_ANGAN|nr:hypothetical protein ANANG_G00295120 [Anguilla anguilla]
MGNYNMWIFICVLFLLQNCEGLRCVDRPCENGGTCMDSPSRCVCRPGYLGPLCQYPDPCQRSPCLNGAACKTTLLKGVPQATCVCQRGYRGPDCSLTDACANNPCANGARCTNWNGRYNCSCPPGYLGKNCRNDIDECRKPDVCLNGRVRQHARLLPLPVPAGVQRALL